MKSVDSRRVIPAAVTLMVPSLLASSVAHALDTSVSFIGGEATRSLLGDGTGVVAGVLDSGIDDAHPALAGFDSLGQPRLLAEANFVPSEPGSTGDDVFGHGTQVAGIIGSSDSLYTGMAPDVRFVNARVLDSGNGFASSSQVLNGAGFAVDQGADVLNLSLNTSGNFSDANLAYDRMLDWAAVDRGVISAVASGNTSQGGGVTTVRSPGGAYNALSVGWTTADFQRVNPGSSTPSPSTGE